MIADSMFVPILPDPPSVRPEGRCTGLWHQDSVGRIDRLEGDSRDFFLSPLTESQLLRGPVELESLPPADQV
jgi:hypothetical protein